MDKKQRELAYRGMLFLAITAIGGLLALMIAIVIKEFM